MGGCGGIVGRGGVWGWEDYGGDMGRIWGEKEVEGDMGRIGAQWGTDMGR